MRATPESPGGKTISCSAFKHTLSNHEALNFTGAFVDFRYPRISVVSLDAKLGGVPVPSVDLNRLVGDARTRFRRVELCFCALQRVADVLILFGGSAKGKEPRGVELGRHVGEHELNGLQVGDRPPEGLSLLRVSD